MMQGPTSDRTFPYGNTVSFQCFLSYEATFSKPHRAFSHTFSMFYKLKKFLKDYADGHIPYEL